MPMRLPPVLPTSFDGGVAWRYLLTATFAVLLGCAGSAVAADALKGDAQEAELKKPPLTTHETLSPRNVILIIGDGMDDQQITIARNYLAGASGRLTLDQMPVRSSSQILTVTDEKVPTPVYVADSANTASSMATGVVTSRGRIATSAGNDKDLVTIAELATAAGYRTGIVATSSVTDATPASFASHISFRLCQNPSMMELVTYGSIELGECNSDMKANGGAGSIAEQLAESAVDVILGGGAKHFVETAEGMTISVKRLAEKNGFRVVSTREALLRSTPGQRLLGLFSETTMPVRLRGENDRGSASIQRSLLNRIHTYLGSAELPEVIGCEPNPDFSGMPTLQEMTETALTLLSTDNERGFFLVVESASIDKQSHERKPCGSIGELEQLEEALQSALAFSQQQPDTLILVTADHAQAAQIIPHESLFAAYPIPTYTPGMLSRIRTPEGSVLAINYATTNFMMEEHTGASVPLFANEAGAGRVPPFIQQPDLFEIMRDYLHLPTATRTSGLD